MRTNFKQKVLVSVALISVLGISIGFAAFSSSLRIKTKLGVTPDSSTFGVVFSSNSSKEETNDISPQVSGDNSSNIVATDATINNSSVYPTVGDIHATFTAPGQSVSYTFYALNKGKYDAYLTSVVLNPLDSGSFIECTPGVGTDATKVALACKDISVQIQVGSESFTSTKLGIENHLLLQDKSETVTITFSYSGTTSTLVDGPFDISVGNIYLTYGTQMTGEMPEFNDTYICEATDNSKAGSTVIGTKYSCLVNSNNSYNFYVLSTSGDNVSLIMETNLEDNVEFSTTLYENYSVETLYMISGVPNAVSRVMSLTSNWINIPSLNESYTDISGSYTVNLNGRARLPKYSELTSSSVCAYQKAVGEPSYSGGAEPTNPAWYGCPNWSLGNYWTMDTTNSYGAWAMNTEYNTLDDFALRVEYDSCMDSVNDHGTYTEWCSPVDNFGIRPVITVDKSMLG